MFVAPTAPAAIAAKTEYFAPGFLTANAAGYLFVNDAGFLLIG